MADVEEEWELDPYRPYYRFGFGFYYPEAQVDLGLDNGVPFFFHLVEYGILLHHPVIGFYYPILRYRSRRRRG